LAHRALSDNDHSFDSFLSARRIRIDCYYFACDADATNAKESDTPLDMDITLCLITLMMLISYAGFNSIITYRLHQRTKKIEAKGK
jgi:hypothetical protein